MSHLLKYHKSKTHKPKVCTKVENETLTCTCDLKEIFRILVTKTDVVDCVCVCVWGGGGGGGKGQLQ